MSAPARLLALHVQGFKSFAERTHVEFGGGISAIVGPNGSGKSNLADALRWALGEQGRALRSRKAEDVIFAGSEKRPALGMADVTIVLDNADGLLPVEYSVLELGRRLYRSGENDYLLNRQRVRLKDLVDLLDAAHLADNAFLFIGQGMVDQALALRPEERRPLFEEVAGVRRHERRRRKAEEQLLEAEANLARVEDILAELRPQARRLGAQAEQQLTRTSAGDELAAALVAAAHGRWHDAASRGAAAGDRLARARAEMDRALGGLSEAEAAAAAIAAALGARSQLAGERRAAHDAVRTTLGALEVRAARSAGDLAAAARDRRRIEDERRAAEEDLALRRRELAVPLPEIDHELERAAGDAERALAEAVTELAAVRASRHAQGEALAAARRAEGARSAEIETTGRRLADAERRVAEERARAEAAALRRAETDARLDEAREAVAASVVAERAAVDRREAARAAADVAEGDRRAAAERASVVGSRRATVRGRVEAARARLAEDEARGIARAARRVGGRRLDEDLAVDPTFRAAVEMALGEAARAYLVGPDEVVGLAGERGMLALGAPNAAPTGGDPATPPADLAERLLGVGGGWLAEAVRRDPSGAARAVLGHVAWVPDLPAALAVRDVLPPGWSCVTRDGRALVSFLTVTLGRTEGALERRAELERLATELEALEVEAGRADELVGAADDRATEARAAAVVARAEEAAAGTARRAAEEAERATGRAAESLAREAGWHAAQATRADSDVARLREMLAGLGSADGPAGGPLEGPPVDAPGGDGRAPAPDPAGALETRVVELRDRRDRAVGRQVDLAHARRAAEAASARAGAAVAFDEERIARATRDLVEVGVRETAALVERDGLAGEIADAASREELARTAIGELEAADALDRARLADADAAATTARERLRAAEERLRAAEVADLEVRLGLDAIREQVLVELAGIGEVGLAALRAAAPAGGSNVPALGPSGSAPAPRSAGGPTPEVDSDDTAALEAVLPTILPTWTERPPAADPPGPGRLATLRRRYHELGAANPFAVDEYAALNARLGSLETQEHDLRAAIATTRQLIEELGMLVATQFQDTFRKLEVAFDERFRQLFGGGFARLDLTDPSDLAATGVEIVARPPGKKAQALAMLSGGERALTAVALLFAMLAVRPVPFCVLDEVDAALDEANVGRFTDALTELAAHTQFVVITHNRGTIEAADALYGVTVGEDSVSRVISLRLDEARAIADRASGSGAGRPAPVAG